MNDLYIVLGVVTALMSPAYILLRSISSQIHVLQEESRSNAVAIANINGRLDTNNQ